VTTTTTARTTIRSGFDWAQALREREDCLDVCRELFVCPITSRLLLDDLAFREAVLGKSVLNLYRLNKVGGRNIPSPHHQVRLLALVNDDLDCIYIQFRECGSIHLIPSRASERDLF
jgi:hypothetical protein